MKKIHTPNHKLYEEDYLNQAKQKGGSLPAFHGTRFQRGYGLGYIFKGLFRWAVPHLQQGSKMLGKKDLQTGVDVVCAKQVLGLPSQDSPQSGAGKKGTKRKAQPRKNSSPPGKKQKTSPQKEKPENKFSFLK